jgi:hypothetical protein
MYDADENRIKAAHSISEVGRIQSSSNYHFWRGKQETYNEIIQELQNYLIGN